MENRHSEAGYANEVFLDVLAVCGAVSEATAHRRAHYERRGHLPGVHAAELRRVVEQLVEAQRKKIAEHDFNDRTSAAESKAITNAHDARLADRRVDHTIRMLVG